MIKLFCVIIKLILSRLNNFLSFHASFPSFLSSFPFTSSSHSYSLLSICPSHPSFPSLFHIQTANQYLIYNMDRIRAELEVRLRVSPLKQNSLKFKNLDTQYYKEIRMQEMIDYFIKLA